MNPCTQIREQIAALEHNADVDHHLTFCAGCRSFADDIFKLKQISNSFPPITYLKGVQFDQKDAIPFWKKNAWVFSVAFSLLIIGTASIVLSHYSPKTTISPRVIVPNEQIAVKATNDTTDVLAFLENGFSLWLGDSIDNDNNVWFWKTDRSSFEELYFNNSYNSNQEEEVDDKLSE